MEQNTEQADALTKCVEIAPSYSKITHVTRRVNELLDLSYTDAKWRGLLKDNPSEHERIKKALGTAKDETPDTIRIDGNIIGAVINDVHVPYHDKVAISLACKVLAWWKPEVLIYNGDLLDFYDLSRYDKNPGRQYRLQDEIDLFHTDVIAPVKRFRQIQQIISRFIVYTHLSFTTFYYPFTTLLLPFYYPFHFAKHSIPSGR